MATITMPASLRTVLIVTLIAGFGQSGSRERRLLLDADRSGGIVTA